MKQPTDSQTHPASQWAARQDFNSIQIDCITAIVLKILDGKCKMHAGEKVAIMHIYDTVSDQPGMLFNAEHHHHITHAREQNSAQAASRVHQLRVHAESMIPKPVMKQFKAVLREGLFG